MNSEASTTGEAYAEINGICFNLGNIEEDSRRRVSDVLSCFAIKGAKGLKYLDVYRERIQDTGNRWHYMLDIKPHGSAIAEIRLLNGAGNRYEHNKNKETRCVSFTRHDKDGLYRYILFHVNPDMETEQELKELVPLSSRRRRNNNSRKLGK